MTFDEWWATLDTWEQNRRVKEDAKEAFQAGKLEAAQHILNLFEQHPWAFYRDLQAYVEELK